MYFKFKRIGWMWFEKTSETIIFLKLVWWFPLSYGHLESVFFSKILSHSSHFRGDLSSCSFCYFLKWNSFWPLSVQFCGCILQRHSFFYAYDSLVQNIAVSFYIFISSTLLFSWCTYSKILLNISYAIYLLCLNEKYR